MLLRGYVWFVGEDGTQEKTASRKGVKNVLRKNDVGRVEEV